VQEARSATFVDPASPPQTNSSMTDFRCAGRALFVPFHPPQFIACVCFLAKLFERIKDESVDVNAGYLCSPLDSRTLPKSFLLKQTQVKL
jgi:hypothetical protein